MIFISEYEVISQDKIKEKKTYWQPFHEVHGLGKTAEQLETEGILVDITETTLENAKQEFIKTNIPPTKYHIPTWYYNPTTKSIFFEYVETIPQEDIDEMTKLKNDMATMQDTINFLLGL